MYSAFDQTQQAAEDAAGCRDGPAFPPALKVMVEPRRLVRHAGRPRHSAVCCSWHGGCRHMCGLPCRSKIKSLQDASATTAGHAELLLWDVAAVCSSKAAGSAEGVRGQAEKLQEVGHRPGARQQAAKGLQEREISAGDCRGIDRCCSTSW